MRKLMIAAIAAAALTVGAYASAISANKVKVIVIDAPDVKRLSAASGVRTSAMIGKAVYGNGGGKIGEIRDFILSSGHFYAVLDTKGSPIEPHLQVGANDIVVIPWKQLRVVEKTALPSRR